MPKILKSNLIINKCDGFSYNDFTYIVHSSHIHKHTDPSYSIYLGTWKLCDIIYASGNGRWYMSYNYNSSYGSLNGAIKGLLRRLNSKS